MGAVMVRPEPNEMPGEEMVSFAREHKRLLRYRTQIGGATEVGVCQACKRPFFYNHLVIPPETCGRTSCEAGKPDQELTWEIPAPSKKPRRTRKPSASTPLDDAEPDELNLALTEPLCWCTCHANAYMERWGMVPPETDWLETCEHCTGAVD